MSLIDICTNIVLVIIPIAMILGLISVYLSSIEYQEQRNTAYEQCPSICEAKGYKGFVDYSYISNDLVCECSNNRVQIKGDK